MDGDGIEDLVVASFGAVELPDLPPPDGTEKLYLRKPCSLYASLCVQTMLDGLTEDLTALDPATDMTSPDPAKNATRKAKLLAQLDKAKQSFSRGKTNATRRKLQKILKRGDYKPSPPDWIAYPAANRIADRLRFALNAL